jgi:hypothetical protein
MKKVLTKFLVISGVTLLMLSACKKTDPIVKSNGGTAGVLSANTTTLPLDKSKLNDTTNVISFTVTKPNFGFSAAVSNTLQIDAAGDNWANPTTVALGSKVYSQGYTTAAFNAMLLKLNLAAGVASQVQVRVQHSIGVGAPPVYSNVLSLTVTPFNLATFLYVPGAYEGWGNPGAQEDSLLSATSNGVFTGVINFTPGNDGFDITPVKNWSNKYNTLDPAVSASATSAIYAVQYVTGGGNDFHAPKKPTVDPAVNITSNQVVLDINKNTLTLTPTLWSVVGDASPGGWPAGNGTQSDTDMKFNNATQTWSVVVVLKAGGAIKFRLNHDWGTNYGSTSAGTLDTNANNNISITADGTYLVTIDIAHLTYTLVKQ